jgi:hyaluronoglucosaminidase
MPKRFFGYIEGYYGRMLSWDERALLIEKMRRLSLNAYIYAPKEDPFHRQHWKIPYPVEWRNFFGSFVNQSKKAGITVIPGIAPGLSFDYQSRADYAILLKKFLILLKSGVNSLCLLMDDIPVDLPDKYKKKYSSLGAAHGELLTKLQADIKKNVTTKLRSLNLPLRATLGSTRRGILRGVAPQGDFTLCPLLGNRKEGAQGREQLQKTEPDIKFWFCPTVYNDYFMTKDNAARYLDDLALYMPEDTMILWTGTNVISENITGDSIKDVVKLFGNNVCIWDNIYANDYCPSRLFTGPYINRSADLQKTTSGILLNPTGLLHTDIFLLSLLAGYVNRINPQKAWQSIASKLPVAKELKIIAPFLNIPCSTIAKANLTPRYLKLVHEALEKMIWEWKSPLQREWYPFLYMLDCNIKLWNNKADKDNELWIKKKYPPVLADILLAHIQHPILKN